MKQPRRLTQQHLAERLYALWLHVYPRAHRDAYGALMLQIFRDMCRDARATRGTVNLRLWLQVAADEARSLPKEYGAALKQQRRRLEKPAHALAYSALLLGGAVAYIVICPR